MRLQNKKNLRQRMNRLHLAVNNISEYKVAIEHIGSLKRGNGQISASDTGDVYDLDVNFIIKTNDNAAKVRSTMKSDIMKVTRDHESITDMDRVIRIMVNEDGYKYNFDIAIKNYETNEIAARVNGNIR